MIPPSSALCPQRSRKRRADPVGGSLREPGLQEKLPASVGPGPGHFKVGPSVCRRANIPFGTIGASARQFEPIKRMWIGLEPIELKKSDSRNHCAIVQPRVYDCAMVTQITLYTQAHTPICVQLQTELDTLCARACACAYRARTHILQVGSKTSCKPRCAADATPSARTLWHALKHARTHSSTVCVCMSSAHAHVHATARRSRRRRPMRIRVVNLQSPRTRSSLKAR